MKACGTRDPFLIQGRQHISLTDASTTGRAQYVAARVEVVVNGHPAVEDKALASPKTLVLGCLFEVLQDAPLEVKDLRIAGLDEQ